MLSCGTDRHDMSKMALIIKIGHLAQALGNTHQNTLSSQTKQQQPRVYNLQSDPINSQLSSQW